MEGFQLPDMVSISGIRITSERSRARVTSIWNNFEMKSDSAFELFSIS